jgi:RNA polymerase sigma factor for flagellar operon FliA
MTDKHAQEVADSCSGLSAKDRERLVTDNLRLAYAIARDHCRRFRLADPDDTRSEALVGLIDAARRYDPTKGADFLAFAAPRIKGQILDGQRKFNGLLRNTPANESIVVRSRVVSLFNDTTVASIDTTLDGEESLMGVVTDVEDRGCGVEEVVERHIQSDELLEAARQLTYQQQLVIVRYHFAGLTMAEIGSEIGVTESRVSKIHSEAVRRLRFFMERASRASRYPIVSEDDIKQITPLPLAPTAVETMDDETVIRSYLQCLMGGAPIPRSLLGKFVMVAYDWAEKNDIPVGAFLRMNVPANTLRRAGFVVPRKRSS